MNKFIPMKPHKLSLEELKQIKLPCYVSPKFDGMRVVILNGKALSYSLKPIPNHHIRTSLEKLFGHLGYYLIDGEGMLMDEKATFQDIMSAYMSREGRPDFRYVMFDALEPCLTDCTYTKRLTDLDGLKHGLGFPIHANKYQQLETIHYRHYYCQVTSELEGSIQHMLDRGYEGAIIRSPDGGYKFGRSTLKSAELLAYKPFTDAEAIIEGYYALERNCNIAELDNHGHQKRGSSQDNKVEANMLGGINVIAINGKFDGQHFNIGSGFTEQQRIDLWKLGTKLIDRTVKFKYQEIGSKEKPRTPIFLGFRSKEDM